jgi:hypothetical protein
MTICYILMPFGICIFWLFGIVCGHLVQYFPVLVCLNQVKSGNPAYNQEVYNNILILFVYKCKCVCICKYCKYILCYLHICNPHAYVQDCHCCRQANPNGQCAKAVLANGTTAWVIRDCAETTGKFYVCQRRQNLEDIDGGDIFCAGAGSYCFIIYLQKSWQKLCKIQSSIDKIIVTCT